MTTALWWMRRDLRLADNQALHAALAHAEHVVPVFVLDPALLTSPRVGPTRVAFLLGGLRQLEQELRRRGSRLIIRHGDPTDELAALLSESEASVVFAEEDFSPYARQRDARVSERLPLHLAGSCVVHPPGTVMKADGTPYTVFTPFSRKWKSLPHPRSGDVIPVPDHISTPHGLHSLPIPSEPALPSSVPFPPGEAEAQRRLAAFASQPGISADAPIYAYATARNRLDMAGTSRLSPYLHLGMLSARQAVVAARDALDAAPDTQGRQGAETWLNELIWREFYVHILYHFPHVLEENFRAALRTVAWDNDETTFAAWCAGRTGYPVVDAGMRQLAQTGWMQPRSHDRGLVLGQGPAD